MAVVDWYNEISWCSEFGFPNAEIWTRIAEHGTLILLSKR